MPQYQEYWNPKNETLPREELRALQFLKLRRLCEAMFTAMVEATS